MIIAYHYRNNKQQDISGDPPHTFVPDAQDPLWVRLLRFKARTSFPPQGAR